MQFSADHADTLRELLTWRRDVRHFRTDPVDEAVLEELRATMELAPSVGNARPWRVIRVDDPDLRELVRAEYRASNNLAAAAYDDPTRAEYLRLKLSGMEAAPIQLAVFTETAPAAGRGLGRRTIPATLRASTAMAVYTLWLAARARNLGLGWVSILRPERLRELLEVPPSWEFEGWLCLGHPAAGEEAVSDIPLLHRTGWQANTETAWEQR